MFYIQDPRIESSFLLNEALLDACKNAIYGAGTYAFVSADGLQLLMKSSEFEHFMNNGHYFLLMGMDEITNVKSLEKAEQFCNIYSNLTVRAFVHHTLGSTFHPKFSWFKYDVGGVLVLGSGNLTAKGLRKNTEAFVVQPVDEENILRIEQTWNNWIEQSQHCIKELNNREVISKAEKNAKKPPQKIMQVSAPDLSEEEDLWTFDPNSEVIITELPPSQGAKWKSQNFFFREPSLVKTLFKTDIETARKIVLKQVSEKDGITNIEILNFKKNPIGVFVKISVRTFLYMIVTSNEPYYPILQEKLNYYRWDTSQLVRYETDAIELQRIVPSLPILIYVKE